MTGKYGEELEVPQTFAWSATAGIAKRSREEKFRLFMNLLSPSPTDRVLDVGASNSMERSSNFLEVWYPWPENITALSDQPLEALKAACPKITAIQGDCRALPFPNDSFDIGFSNAVVEHVGSREQQRNAMSELTRTCRRVFVTTPNRWFPVDPHTLLPLVHWLPTHSRSAVLRLLGKNQWASEDILNPLSARELKALFPERAQVSLLRQRFLSLAQNLVVVSA